jgi:uncharacterized iron-regulated membrane protein
MRFIDRPRDGRGRRLLFLVHLWVGLIIGPVVAVVSLTGAIVVFRYELNRMTTPGTAYVTPQARRLTIDELMARIRAAYPRDTFNSVGWGEAGPDNAWNFRMISPEGHRIHTYVNQYTGEITGRDDYHDKWMQWFFDLHAYLLGGDTGEFINGFVGLALILLGVTGLVVWWPGRSHWRFGFIYAWTTGWKRQNYDLHKVVGFYSSVAVTIIAATGTYYCFPSLYKAVTERVVGAPVMTDAPRASTQLADRRVPFEVFIQAAERAQPGASAVQMGFPGELGAPVTVRTKEPRDWHRIGLNYVYLEPADASLLRSLRFSEANVATQTILLMYPLHFGRFGGRWGSGVAFYGVMAAYVALGLMPVVLFVTGLLMYWNRSLVKKWRRFRAPVAVPAAERLQPGAGRSGRVTPA